MTKPVSLWRLSSATNCIHQGQSSYQVRTLNGLWDNTKVQVWFTPWNFSMALARRLRLQSFDRKTGANSGSTRCRIVWGFILTASGKRWEVYESSWALDEVFPVSMHFYDTSASCSNVLCPLSTWVLWERRLDLLCWLHALFSYINDPDMGQDRTGMMQSLASMPVAIVSVYVQRFWKYQKLLKVRAQDMGAFGMSNNFTWNFKHFIRVLRLERELSQLLSLETPGESLSLHSSLSTQSMHWFHRSLFRYSWTSLERKVILRVKYSQMFSSVTLRAH